MKSYYLGFLGFAFSIVLLSLVSRYFYLKKEKSDRKIIIISSIIGVLLILFYFFITKYFLGFQTDEKDSLLYTILFTLLITPIFEEIIYRRWILQHYYNLSKEKVKIKHLIVGIWTALALTLPALVFFFLGLVGGFSIKDYSFIFLFALLPFFTIFVLTYSKSKFNKVVILFVVLISQAFLFTLSHDVYASKSHIITGLLYGVLYLTSKSIIPPLIAHYTWNLLIFIYSN